MNTTEARTVTVTKRDGTTKTVESPHTDAEAITRLAELNSAPGAKPSSFALDLAHKGTRYRLSEKQIAWVHIIVCESDTPRQESPVTMTLPRLRAMLDLAGETLKSPKINLETEGGGRVRLARAGQNSKNFGRIHITDGRPFGESTYYGYIDLDGGLHPRPSADAEVIEALIAFDEDTAGSASAYGHRTGACCFCRRLLTDGRSVAQGYGPICAEKFGLPWGDERAASTVEVK